MALHRGHVKVTGLLPDAEAAERSADASYGITALWEASRRMHVEVARIQLHAGADIESAATGRVSPMMMSA